jgi:hypothetical protein
VGDPDIDDMRPKIGQKLEPWSADESQTETPALNDLRNVDVKGDRWRRTGWVSAFGMCLYSHGTNQRVRDACRCPVS